MLATEVKVVYAVRRLDEEPFEPGAQTLGPIDRVRVHRTVIDSTFQLPARGTYVIDGGRDPRDPKRRLAIELRAELR